MDIGIRSRLTSGFAVVSVGALVMTPVVAGQAAQTPTSAVPPAVMLAAAPLHPPPRPGPSQAPPQLAPLQQAPRPMAAPPSNRHRFSS